MWYYSVAYKDIHEGIKGDIMNVKLSEKIDKIKKMSVEELCKKFNCKPEEICLDDYIANQTNDTVCPYKVILGFANFENSSVTSLGNLEIVYGKKFRDAFGPITDINHQPIYLGINLKNSKIKSLENVRKIYGSITLNENIKSLNNVEYIGSNLYLSNLNLEDFGNLQIVDGTLCIDDDERKCKATSLKNIRKIRTLYLNTNCLKDTGAVEEIKDIQFGPKCNFRICKLFKDKFKRIDGKFVRKDLIENMDLDNEVQDQLVETQE